MKRFETIFIVVFAILLTGCSQKKNSGDIITQKVEAPKLQAPIRMQEYKQSEKVEWMGKEYQVEITRVADDSLRMVKDETGQQFVDNRIELKVLGKDGKVFFAKRFTKAAFEPYLNEDYRRTGILEGFVFSKVEDRELEFAASISHPQTDEYIPLVVKVNNLRRITIQLDTKMDTAAEDERVNEDQRANGDEQTNEDEDI